MPPIVVTGSENGLKSIPLNSLPESAWSYVTGRPDGTDRAESIADRYEDIPWLYRGVTARVNALVGTPIVLMPVGNEQDEYTVTEALPFLKHFTDTLSALATHYILYGRCYALVVRNRLNGIIGFEVLNPSATKPIWNADTGEIDKFERNVNDKKTTLPKEDVFYVWKVPHRTERGWGISDAQVAIKAAGVLYYTDVYASRLFAGGAINPTILTLTEGTQEPDRERIESWARRTLGGIKRAFGITAVAGDVKPVTIGQDLDKLALPALTKTKREDIATALGVPQTLLFSNAANYATSKQDDIHFYDKTVKPDGWRFEEALNEMLFNPLGYVMSFRFNRLEVYQQSETEKSQGLVQLVHEGILTIDEARQELEYEPFPPEEISDSVTQHNEQIYEYHITTGTVLRNEVRERLGLPPLKDDSDNRIRILQSQLSLVDQAVQAGMSIEDAASLVGLQIPKRKVDTTQLDELKRWRRVATTRYQEGHLNKALDFKSDVISPPIMAGIRSALGQVKSANDIQRIFQHALGFSEYP